MPFLQATRRVLLNRPVVAATAQTFLEMIQTAGLTSGLVLCLDAADGDCYSGTGQQFSDVSGQGNHYNLGATSGAEASDPTFVGTADDRLEGTYFSCDGGDYFAPTAAHAFANNFHKDNATFTVVCVAYIPSAGGQTLRPIISTVNDFTTGTGFQVYAWSDESFTVDAENAGANVLHQLTAISLVVNDAWNYMAVSLDEAVGAGGINYNVNGTAETDTSTYSSPSASDPTAAPHIFRRGATGDIIQNGARFGVLAVWNTALSAANLATLRTALANRFTGI